MVFKASSSPFGSRTRTRLVIALVLLRASFPRELARMLGTHLNAVRKALASLEQDGLVAGRSIGRTRVYEFNPSYFAYREFRRFAVRLADADSDLRRGAEQLRRRPRRTGKPL